MSWSPAPPVGSATVKVRPSAWWYLVVVVLWLATIGLVASVVVTGARILNDGVGRVPQNGAVHVPSDGLTLYASHKSASHSCNAASTSRGTVKLPNTNVDLVVTVNGRRVYPLATTPDGMTPGFYRIACSGVAPGTTLWTGDRIPLLSIGIRAILATVCFLGGLAFLIVLLIRRSIGKRRARQGRLGAPGGYPPSGYPTSGYQTGWYPTGSQQQWPPPYQPPAAPPSQPPDGPPYGDGPARP